MLPAKKIISTSIYSCIVALFLLIVSIMGAKWWADNHQPFVSYTSPPFLTLPGSSEKVTSVPQGSGVILNIEGLRQPYSCWGEYITVLSGPVSYTLPLTYSQILDARPTSYKLAIYFQLPSDLPVGVYRWTRQGKPTCNGFDLRPFPLDMYGLTMTVTKR